MMTGIMILHLLYLNLFIAFAKAYPDSRKVELPAVELPELELLHDLPKVELLHDLLEVELPQGKFQGTREILKKSSRYYFSFQGIPYAQPPVGDLRFKDPIKAAPWKGVRKSKNPPPCPQLFAMEDFVESNTVIGEEDCLQLNVYSPSINSSEPLPVMVYIHGGGYRVGSIGPMGGTPERLLVKDIVLVSIQYRLNALGFLSTEDSVIPGNFGLKDQTLALKWVKDNIAHFGGDTERITIFGQSVGGVSTHMHLLTPYSKGLFNQAILMSGTSLNFWATRNDHAKSAMQLARNISCPGVDLPSFDSSQLLQCAQKASMEDLIKANFALGSLFFPFYMEPRVDGDYLPAEPSLLLKEGKYQKTHLMIGNVQNEGTIFVKALMESGQAHNQTFIQNYVHEVLPIISGMEKEENTEYLTKRIFFHFLHQLAIDKENAYDLQQMLTEIILSHDIDEVALLHGRDSKYGKSTYRYIFEHQGERPFADISKFGFGEGWVSHGNDLKYLFDGVFNYSPVQRIDDVLMSDIMITLWTNFATTGNPTPNMELGFKWEPMQSPSDLRYLSLLPAPVMKQGKRNENREFWRNLPLKRNKELFPEVF